MVRNVANVHAKLHARRDVEPNLNRARLGGVSLSVWLAAAANRRISCGNATSHGRKIMNAKVTAQAKNGFHSVDQGPRSITVKENDGEHRKTKVSTAHMPS